MTAVSPLDQDLVILVPDHNMEHALRGLLTRHQSLRTRSIRHVIICHPGKDPGCYHGAELILHPYARSYAHALVMFDRIGCGQEAKNAEEISQDVRRRLHINGWEDRADVIVLDPELEIWVWTSSPHVDECLGWHDRQPTLREWLRDRGYWPDDASKPHPPKEAMEAALRQVSIPRSSSIYSALAQRVSLAGHNERAFCQLVETLRRWFPAWI